MEKVSIAIPNDIKLIVVVMSGAVSYAKILGFSEKECSHIELILEEVLSNVIKFDYMPGQSENIVVDIESTTLGIGIRIKSNGIPLDVESIKSYENVSIEQILTQNVNGLGTLLIKKFADNIKYTNKGKEGQEIEIEKYLSAETALVKDNEVISDDAEIAKVTDFEFYVRRLHPFEAHAISKLAYYAYKQSYIYEYIYFPDRVKQLNLTNQLMSYVAVNKANEEIIGHSANIPEIDSDLCEIGVAFVNPAYRGAGCLKDILEYQFQEMIGMEFSGICAYALTAHPYSQRAAYKKGLRESALYISKLISLELNQINISNKVRASYILMFYYFKDNKNKNIFVPEKHKNIIGKIYKNLGISNRILEISNRKNISTEETAIIEIHKDAHFCAHIHICKYGKDVKENIHHTLKTFCINRIETVFLYVPLDCPETSELCNDFENMGFFFCGIKPGKGHREWLILQYLNNQNYNYESLVFCSEFGEMLLKYIKENDPSQNI